MMDLWQLKIFCKVVELQSFSKAADAVHLSQPTVSSHIKDLEDHFATQLIDRMSRKVYPTRAGELLYDYARRLLSLRDKAESAMAEFTGKIRGEISIGGSTIPAGYILPQVIGQFSNAYPDVRISLVVGDTSEILAKTADGHLELSIVGAVSKERSLDQTKLISDDMVLVVQRHHRWSDRESIKLAELTKEPFIIREEGSGTLKSIEHALNQKDLTVNDLNVVAVMGSTEAVRQGIISNAGVSILSAIAVAEACRSGTLKTLKIEGLQLNRSFYLTTHRQRSLSPLSRTFIEFLHRTMQGSILER
ncbi:MAG: selenium metabolism-associated LysR family transcriptional regulator [Desulfobacteraceae bacterium]